MATKYVRDTSAEKSISVSVIFKGPRFVATVQTYHGDSTCLVNVWQDAESAKRSVDARNKAGNPFPEIKYETPGYFQHGRAGGYGYDKFASALSGLNIDGHEMTDHCGGRLKLPKGQLCFPRDFKAPKGYHVANFGQFSKEHKRKMHAYDWQDKAKGWYLTGGKTEILDEELPKISVLADELKQAWQWSDDYIEGYSDCYRATGLKYLSAIGYTVKDAL